MTEKKIIPTSEQPDTTAVQETIDALRQALSEGAFGTEEKAEDADDAVVGTAVEKFIELFGAKEDTPLKAYDWKAYIPGHMDNDLFWGPVYGVIRKETESIYIFDSKRFEDSEHLIGFIDNGSYQAQTSYRTYHFPENRLIGIRKNNQLTLKLTSKPNLDSDYYGNMTFDVRVKTYDMVTNLFSRNTGLLESDTMLDKRAVLVGCGSVGSFAAMELARSGVGKFVLCDTDILEIHNICRHQCGFDDLGRYKVDAVKDKILNINPDAEVITYRSIIQRVPEDQLFPLLGRNTIIIGGGDNRASADWACKLAIKTDSTFVSTGCWTRAFAGEIFYWASGRNLSCYSCALGGLIDDERPESHAAYFGSDEEKEILSFEPGIAADIDFVTIIAVKLALDLINRDNPDYTPRVINYLKQYTWVCNTNDTNIGGPRAAMFPNPLWITNNLTVNKEENCPYCGNK